MIQRELGPQLSQNADKDLEGSIALAPPVKCTIEYDEETGKDRIKLSSKSSDELRLSILNQPCFGYGVYFAGYGCEGFGGSESFGTY